MVNDPRLDGADGAFSPHKASAQLRSPPYIEHLGAAASVAVETELCDLSSQSAAALKLNKVLIQSVIFTLLCREVGEDVRCVYVMFVVSRSGSVIK